MNRAEFQRIFPRRKVRSHKGDFGKILIVAGSLNYPGAPYLVSMGAVRSGAGLVTLAVPKSLHPVMARKLTEAMPQPLPETSEGAFSLRALSPLQRALEACDVLAIGPGLGRQAETQKLVRKLVLSSRKPLVLDADGLNAFAGRVALLRKVKAPAVLTPHPGEAARLAGIKIPEDDQGRRKFAAAFVKKYRVLLVLKGHHTVVASPGGSLYVNRTGNPGLAKGGSGDLLTGILAAFLGQDLSPFHAAKCAVFIHGLAADLAAGDIGQISLTASDVLKYLPQAFQRLGR